MTAPSLASPSPLAPLARAAAWCAGLSGWRRLLTAFLFGALAAAALPPVYLVPLLWPAFTGLLWLLNGVRGSAAAFALGWAFGAGFYFAGLYWVGIAFTVDAPRFGALAPVAVLALSAGLALFTALVTLVVHRVAWRGPARVLILAGAWLGAEWLRSWVLTGFPWNLIGTVWAFSAETIQLAALTGVWGLSWITLAAAAAPAVATEPGGRWRRWAPAGLGVLVLAAVFALSAGRLAVAPSPGERSVDGVMLRLVQPSIEQSDKWRRELRQQHVIDQMRLSVEPGFDAVTHVVWAETAVPYILNRDETLRRALGQVVPEGGLLLTGAPREARAGGRSGLWNTLFALDREGALVEAYDKVKLVPFGEYVPLRGLFGFSKLTEGRADFSSGVGRRTLALPGLPPVSPLICYEVIYPGQVTDPDRPPAWLLTVTNDAWFGRSSGPFQHFASARLRAVEEGLPLVRVANNGVSAVVDGYGRVLARLGLDQVGRIDSALPRPLESRTPFVIAGNWWVLVLVTLSLLLGYCFRRPG